MRQPSPSMLTIRALALALPERAFRDLVHLLDGDVMKLNDKRFRDLAKNGRRTTISCEPKKSSSVRPKSSS